MQLEKEILEKIHKGELKMYSRAYYIWKQVFVATLTALLFVLAIFFLSFIIFTINHGNIGLLPAFGSRGWYRLFFVFPWVPVLVLLFVVTVIAYILHHTEFVYKKPLLYLPVGLLVIVLLLSLVVHRTSFHGRLSRFSHDQAVPVMDGFYRNFDREDITIGKVISKSPYQWVIITPDGQPVHFSLMGCMPCVDAENVKVGDEITVFGDRTGDQIKVYDIKRGF